MSIKAVESMSEEGVSSRVMLLVLAVAAAIGGSTVDLHSVNRLDQYVHC